MFDKLEITTKVLRHLSVFLEASEVCITLSLKENEIKDGGTFCAHDARVFLA